MERSCRGDREQTLSASQDLVKKTCFSLAELKTMAGSGTGQIAWKHNCDKVASAVTE